MPFTPLMLVQIVATTTFHAAFAGMAGVVASIIQLHRLRARWCNRARQRLQRAMPWCIALAAAAALVELWSEAAAMGDVPWLAAWPAFRTMMTSTHAGTVGIASLAVLGALALNQRRARPDASAMTVSVIPGGLLLLLAAVRAASGHAFDDGPFSTAVRIEWMHLTFMAIWTGSVFAACALVLPALRGPVVATPANRSRYDSIDSSDTTNTTDTTIEWEARRRYLASLSSWATTAVAGIAITGTYNAWHALRAPADLTNTPYGQVLLWKLALVALALLLGGINRFRWLPAASAIAPDRQTGADHALRAFLIVLRIETAVLLGVLLAAAALAIGAPPGA